MKRLLIIMLGIALALALSGCQMFTTSPAYGGGYAEIIMPGNTLVTGEYDKAVRVSNGWIKIHLNGKWYAVNEWRVALTED